MQFPVSPRYAYTSFVYIIAWALKALESFEYDIW